MIENLDDEGWITKFTFRNDTYCIVSVDPNKWGDIPFSLHKPDGQRIYLPEIVEVALRTPFSREPNIEKIEKFLKNYSRDLTMTADRV